MGGAPLENVSGSSTAALATFVNGPTATIETVSTGSCFKTLSISMCAGFGEGMKCRGGACMTSSQA